LNSSYFDTILVQANSAQIKQIAETYEVNFLYVNDEKISISLNEATTISDLNTILKIFAEALSKKEDVINSLTENETVLNGLRRTSPFLENKIFNSYHSETELMRYIKKLERKDLSLNHSMISLGSCTMKLNAASEMFP